MCWLISSLNLITEKKDGLSARNKSEGEAAFVRLRVEDTGTGIPKEIIDKVFDPFFTTKEVGKGTGRGLSTVLGIVKSHGGLISIESNSSGTCFEIQLPADRKSPTKGEPENTSALPLGNGELIMVVDDEAEIRKTFCQILAQNGYTVISAEDGSAAIIEFTRQKTEMRLLITDRMMPGMDGESLIKVISTLKPEMRFIITSGLSDPAVPQPGIALLQKPVSAKELLRVVHETLQDARSS